MNADQIQTQIFQLIQSIPANTGCKIKHAESVQSLWSGYGEIVRYTLENGFADSVIVKHVQLAGSSSAHPRGWDSDISHQRKLHSYQVESYFYSHFKADKYCHFPECLAFRQIGEDVIIVMEDLNINGFPVRKTSVSLDEMKACISWLAHFHARFLGHDTKGLWKTGSYWHLETRPDELKAMPAGNLKKYSKKIDFILENAQYKTIIHGDAKLANFCFPDHRAGGSNYQVAAVDFQYIGGGVGVKDLAYFIGSCLYEDEITSYEDELLHYYFRELHKAVTLYHQNIDFNALEAEWRNLFSYAWTDFHRFLLGWSPGHWKINSYSEITAQKVISEIQADEN